MGTGEGGSGVGAAGVGGNVDAGVGVGASGAAAAAAADAAVNGGDTGVVDPLEINIPAASDVDMGTGVDIGSPLSTEAVDVGGEESGQAVVNTRDTANAGMDMANRNGDVKIDETVGTVNTDAREKVYRNR